MTFSPLKHLGHEGETSRGPEVALDDLDVVLLGQELDVEGARNLQGLGYLAGYLLDPAGGLHIHLLGRELNRSVARVYAGELDVLRDGIGYDGAVVGHCVELYLLGVLNEFRYDNRMFLRDFRR